MSAIGRSLVPFKGASETPESSLHCLSADKQRVCTRAAYCFGALALTLLIGAVLVFPPVGVAVIGGSALGAGVATALWAVGTICALISNKAFETLDQAAELPHDIDLVELLPEGVVGRRKVEETLGRLPSPPNASLEATAKLVIGEDHRTIPLLANLVTREVLGRIDEEDLGKDGFLLNGEIFKFSTLMKLLKVPATNAEEMDQFYHDHLQHRLDPASIDPPKEIAPELVCLEMEPEAMQKALVRLSYFCSSVLDTNPITLALGADQGMDNTARYQYRLFASLQSEKSPFQLDEKFRRPYSGYLNIEGDRISGQLTRSYAIVETDTDTNQQQVIGSIDVTLDVDSSRLEQDQVRQSYSKFSFTPGMSPY